MDDEAAYMRLAEMYAGSKLVLAEKKRKQVLRSAAKACLKKARDSILCKAPSPGAANYYVDKAREIDPDFAKETSIFGITYFSNAR